MSDEETSSGLDRDEADSQWDAFVQDRLYLPPWRDTLSDGRMGPEYGPRTLGAYTGACNRHRESPAGGGLWDASEVGRRQQPERHDEEEMARFMRRRSGTLGLRSVEVYSLFWVDRSSYGVIARLLGVTRKTVQNTVLELRRKMRAAGL